MTTKNLLIFLFAIYSATTVKAESSAETVHDDLVLSSVDCHYLASKSLSYSNKGVTHHLRFHSHIINNVSTLSYKVRTILFCNLNDSVLEVLDGEYQKYVLTDNCNDNIIKSNKNRIDPAN